MNKIYNWFVTSSEDSTKWSLRAQGTVVFLIGILGKFLAVKGISISDAQIQFIGSSLVQLVGAVGLISGFVRYAFNTWVEPKL